MPSGRSSGSRRVDLLPPGRHAKVRPLVFATYGDICHLCGLPGADTVDHVRPGDDHGLANLRPAHDEPCHRRKCAQEGVQARARARESIRRPTEPHSGLR
jgi:5-methylcytosine-specific restriction endonuclease McrA